MQAHRHTCTRIHIHTCICVHKYSPTHTCTHKHQVHFGYMASLQSLFLLGVHTLLPSLFRGPRTSQTEASRGTVQNTHTHTHTQMATLLAMPVERIDLPAWLEVPRTHTHIDRDTHIFTHTGSRGAAAGPGHHDCLRGGDFRVALRALYSGRPKMFPPD